MNTVQKMPINFTPEGMVSLNNYREMYLKNPTYLEESHIHGYLRCAQFSWLARNDLEIDFDDGSNPKYPHLHRRRIGYFKPADFEWGDIPDIRRKNNDTN